MTPQSKTALKNIEKSFQQLSTDTTPIWLNKLRQKGLSRFSKLGVPSIKDEEWKYTNVSSLAENTFNIAKKCDLKETDMFNAYCQDDHLRVVFVNGIYSPELSKLNNISAGLTITTLKESIRSNGGNLENIFTKYDTDQETSFTALNEALTNDATLIEIQTKAICKEVVHIIHVVSNEENILTTPRTIIRLSSSSEATVLESHVAFNDDTSYFANALTDIVIDENATLHYCKAQKESKSAHHIGKTRVWQEKDSTFDGFSVMTGAALTRNDLNITLNGEGCNAILNGLYVIGNDQHTDNHTFVDHRFANCTSNQLYKGILNHSSRAVFNGKIYVHPEAQLTNSYQLNKNILLGNDCRIDTKPQLEIFADDVKCTHGATIGQLNEDEIFYLQSRSIGRKTAIQMLSKGFVDEIIGTIRSEIIQKKANSILQPSLVAING